MIVGPLPCEMCFELLHGTGIVCLLVIDLQGLYGTQNIQLLRISYCNSENTFFPHRNLVYYYLGIKKAFMKKQIVLCVLSMCEALIQSPYTTKDHLYV